uniref:Cadherin domain-containing protein n=1 Tax=Parastrongyloides trichosuri TaxID=131310 RepID=A0A0N4ZRR5_PARTI
MLPIELTTEMKLLSLYTEDEINAYRSSTIFVSENMIEADRDTGNYILVLTNIEDIIRNELVLNYVDRELHKKSIHLRVIQIVADPTKKISKGKIHHSYVRCFFFFFFLISMGIIFCLKYKLLTRSKDSKGRVSLIETYDILDSVKPCPSLSNLQKIHQYGELLKERQINWALDHIEDFIVGGIFVLFAVLAGVLAAIYEMWNNKKLKKKEEMPIKS